MATENLEETITIGKLVFHKDILIFQNTAYRVSNICQMWVADHSFSIKHEIPKWVPVSGIIGILAVATGLLQKSWIGAVFGVVLFIMAAARFVNHQWKTDHPNFALGFELNSGRRTFLVSSDKDFILRAAESLVRAMSSGLKNEEKLVLNFDNKTINIENAAHSNIIGGNVSDSLVNSV